VLAKNKQALDSDRKDKRAGSATGSGRSFMIFPAWRMQVGFPWPIWAVGWLAIFKAFLWLATDPNVDNPLAGILAAKFIIATIPFAVLGVGVWNLKKWAVWGLIGLAVLDLLFFVVFPNATRQLIGNSYWMLAIALMICIGPVGNILILLASPSLIKHAGRQEAFARELS
jgi:hypothetical protein